MIIRALIMKAKIIKGNMISWTAGKELKLYRELERWEISTFQGQEYIFFPLGNNEVKMCN